MPGEQKSLTAGDNDGGGGRARLGSMTFSEAIARHLPRMVFGWLTGDALANHPQFTLAGKHVAAQWYYQTIHRDVPPSLDNDGSAAR